MLLKYATRRVIVSYKKIKKRFWVERFFVWIL